MGRVIKHIVIKGDVQGVGFRYSMNSMAQREGTTGWVRNRRDGSVEAMVQGEEKSVAAVIEWAKQGPSVSRVERVTVSEGTGNFSDFSIRETV